MKKSNNHRSSSKEVTDSGIDELDSVNLENSTADSQSLTLQYSQGFNLHLLTRDIIRYQSVAKKARLGSSGYSEDTTISLFEVVDALHRLRQTLPTPENQSNQLAENDYEQTTITPINIFKNQEYEKYPSYLLNDATNLVSSNDYLLKNLKNADYTVKLLENIFVPDNEYTSFTKHLMEKDKQTIKQIKENYDFCLYKLFTIFAEPEFTESEQALQVLEFLIKKRNVGKIIREEDGIEIIHRLILFNNYNASKWAFEYYSSFKNTVIDLEEIFTLTSPSNHDIFDYLANGIVTKHDAGFKPNLKIIELVLSEYKKVVDNQLQIMKQENSSTAGLSSEFLLSDRKNWLSSEFKDRIGELNEEMSKYLTA